MRGYTDGVQKTISEKSLGKGLNYEKLGNVKDATDEIEIGDLVNDELGDVADLNDIKNLIADGYASLDDGTELELDEENKEVGYRQDWYCVVEDLSEGGLQYIIADDKETVLGARMGVAGEHMGQVSVWLDTYKQQVSGWGETLPVSSEDCDEINEVLQEIFGD